MPTIATIVLILVEWAMGKLAWVVVGWWLGWVRGHVVGAIALKRFEVSPCLDRTPLQLDLTLEIHNGNTHHIVARHITLNLSGSTALVARVTGAIEDIPFLHFCTPKGKLCLGSGEDATVNVRIVPPFDFWLSTDAGLKLESSSIAFDTPWGRVSFPVSGCTKLDAKTAEHRMQIDEYIKRTVEEVKGIVSP